MYADMKNIDNTDYPLEVLIKLCLVRESLVKEQAEHGCVESFYIWNLYIMTPGIMLFLKVSLWR